MREHADWWNVHVGKLDEVDEIRAQVGDARVSIQEMVAFVPNGGDREAITGRANAGSGTPRPAVGTAAELADHYARDAERGVERVYVWFCDFAPPETIAAFGEGVIAPLRSARPGSP